MADNEKEFETIEDFLNDIDGDDEDPTTDPAPAPATEPEKGAGTEGGEPAPDPEVDPITKAEDKTKAKPGEPAPKKGTAGNPMKELRDKANAATRAQEKIEGAITRLSGGDYDLRLKDFKTEDGKVDYDALIAAMDEVDVKKRAEGRGISPELQAEIEKYEREKKEVEIAKARVQMDRQLNNFQMEQKLSPEDLNTFISDTMKIGINPLSIAALDRTAKGTMALKMLYKAVYSDRIIQEAVTKALEEAETKRQADATAQKGQPKANPGAPNTSKTSEGGSKGMALDEFLASIK